MTTPPPGSQEAANAGCRCLVRPQHSYSSIQDGGLIVTHWVQVMPDCPLHGKSVDMAAEAYFGLDGEWDLQP